MSCRKRIGSVCSITGGRAGGQALANLRWILPGSSNVWTLDQAWTWSSLGKSKFLILIFSLATSLGSFWSAWGQISTFGSNSGIILRCLGLIWTSWGTIRSHFGVLDAPRGVRGSILDVPRVILEVILESESEGIPKSGFGVDYGGFQNDHFWKRAPRAGETHGLEGSRRQ